MRQDYLRGTLSGSDHTHWGVCVVVVLHPPPITLTTGGILVLRLIKPQSTLRQRAMKLVKWDQQQAQQQVADQVLSVHLHLIFLGVGVGSINYQHWIQISKI